MNRIICLAIAILVTTLVSGCTFTLNVKPKLDALPEATKNPVHAGVYYSPQFAEQILKRTSGEHTVLVPIGAASVQLFDDLLPRVFEKTTQVSNLTTDEISTKGVDVIIAPTLEHFSFRLQMWEANDERYSVSYRMTLYTPRGVPIASWVVSGYQPKGNWSGGGLGEAWINNDMSDAAAKFLEGFERNAGPVLAAIAKNTGNQSIAVDPQYIFLSAKKTELHGFDSKQVTSLHEAGVVAVQVVIRSDTKRQLVARASDMRLRLKSGQSVEPSSTSSILSTLEQATSNFVAEAFFGPFGVIGESKSKEAAREMASSTLGQTLFRERILNNGKEETGVVFFLLPKGVKAEDGTTLTAWVVDPDLAEGTQTEVSLPVAQ